MKPNLLIIMELKEREFVSKILLAKKFTEAGWRVTLGTINSISQLSRISPPSVILHKGVLTNVETYRSRGHAVAILDEEIGVAIPEKSIGEICRKRFWQFPNDLPDVVFAPNPQFALELRKLPGSEKFSVENTGWPRIDTWFHYLPKHALDKADSLTNEYGSFVLFLSSFGAVTDKILKDIETSQRGFPLIQGQTRERYESFNDQTHFILDLDEELPDDTRIVIRPHPSESVNAWKTLLGSRGRIAVVRDGDVLPWILASKGVVVHGSTTAVQAVLLDKITLQYGVKHELGVTDSLPFSLPTNVANSKQAVDLIFGQKNPNNREAAIKALVEKGWLDPKMSASDKIVSILSSLRKDPSGPTLVPWYLRLRMYARFFASWLKHVTQQFGLFRGTPAKANDRSVYGNMGTGLPVKEIVEALKEFQDDHSQVFAVKKLGPHLVSIELVGQDEPATNIKS